jgi:hypothetical protein
MFPWNLGFWLLLGFAWQLLWPFQWFSHQILLCYEQEGHLHAWRPFPGVATLRSGKQKSTGKGYWMILGPVASCSWSNGQSSHLYNGGCATWHAWHVSCKSGQDHLSFTVSIFMDIYRLSSFTVSDLSTTRCPDQSFVLSLASQKHQICLTPHDPGACQTCSPSVSRNPCLILRSTSTIFHMPLFKSTNFNVIHYSSTRSTDLLFQFQIGRMQS